MNKRRAHIRRASRRSFGGLLAALVTLLACASSASAADTFTPGTLAFTGVVPQAATGVGGVAPHPVMGITGEADGSYRLYFGFPAAVMTKRYDIDGNSLGALRLLGVLGPDDPGTIGGMVRLPSEEAIVSDASGHRLIRLSATDLPVATYGSAGVGPGQFDTPRGVTRAPDGTLLVADSGNDRIMRFAADGTYLATYGSSGSLDGELDNPIGIAAVGDGSFWVVDADNSRIQHFDATGGHLASIGAPGSAPLEFAAPTQMAIATNGDLLIADTGNGRVQRLTSAGAHVRDYGSVVPGPTHLATPTTLLELADGRLIVGELTATRLRVFAADGTDLGTRLAVTDPSQTPLTQSPSAIPGSSTEFIGVVRGGENSPWQQAVRCNVASGCTRLGVPGVDFVALLGVKAAAGGVYYASDIGSGHIGKYSLADGSLLASGGTSGVGPGEFVFPSAIETSSDGRVWVLDPALGKVLRFDSNLNFLDEVAVPVTGYRGAGLWLAADEQSMIVTSLGGVGAVTKRLTLAGAELWSVSSSGSDLVFGGLDLGDGTFLTSGTSVARRRLSDGSLISAAGSLPVEFVGLGLDQLADGTFVIGDAGNGAFRTLTLTPTPLTVSPTAPPPVTLGGASAPTELVFSVENASGQVTFTATFGGSGVTIDSSGRVRVVDLPEGRGTLRVVAVDPATGRTATWEQEVVVDRTAPVFRSPPRFITTARGSLSVRDAVSSPTTTSIAFRARRVGRVTVRARLTDSAGNTAVRSVTLIRRPSLSSGRRNGGIELWMPDPPKRFMPNDSALRAVFQGSLVAERRETPYAPALVREVQFRLKQLGVLSPVVRSSGAMNPATRAALRRFQRSRSLSRTGAPDRPTRRALDSAIEQLA